MGSVGKKSTVAWFSAGASSAVATKLILDEGKDVEIKYIHIDDQHYDTLRFVHDCELVFNKSVEIFQSSVKSVEGACRSAGFVKSPYGAKCTDILKRRVRKQWEKENKGKEITYIWGFDYTERDRAERLEDAMPEFKHRFPLIEQGIDKASAHFILTEKMRIKRPAMYDLGYPNNNCIGCLKGGMGYWNKIRVDFPDVFNARCKMERDIGGTIFNGMYLDELDPSRGRDCKLIIPECGIFCEEQE
jgi:hypothetical protein